MECVAARASSGGMSVIAGEASGWLGREVSLMPIAGLCDPVGQAAQGSKKLLCLTWYLL